ncbi:MAG: DUF2007 domain-containing protein [Candidatus Latescibacterota bacterium]
MSFCPICKYEYVAGIQRCPDCDVVLVDQLSKENRDEAFQLIKLHSFPGEIYAQMVGEALDNEGIPYLVKKEVLGSTTIVQGATEGPEVTLYVNEKDLADAEMILSQLVDHI